MLKALPMYLSDGEKTNYLFLKAWVINLWFEFKTEFQAEVKGKKYVCFMTLAAEKKHGSGNETKKDLQNRSQFPSAILGSMELLDSGISLLLFGWVQTCC